MTQPIKTCTLKCWSTPCWPLLSAWDSALESWEPVSLSTTIWKRENLDLIIICSDVLHVFSLCPSVFKIKQNPFVDIKFYYMERITTFDFIKQGYCIRDLKFQSK
jgi:hypothetical protein